MPIPSDDILIFTHGLANTPQLRQAAKDWVKRNKEIPAKSFEKIVTAFIQDPSALKKCMGGILLGYMHSQRRDLAPGLYDKWLEYTTGWAAVDAICYGNFTAKEILDDFATWKTLIERLVNSDNPDKRRAAIVLLTKPVKESDDKRLSKLAFAVIDTLKDEKIILITKAISWLLRNLTKQHDKEVRAYLDSKKETLPKIAVREVLNKLQHGKKSPTKTINHE
jgi:3-methyladenine DNA glycosylase AlkD